MKQANIITCIGELLIDFFCTDININLMNGASFMKQAGGAPANVAAAVSKLGGASAFVGKVGNDPFGDFLIDALNQANVDTSMISKDKILKTTLAFVSLQANGERDFVFYRGADENLSGDDFDVERVMASSIIHFGSATALLSGVSRATYLALIEQAYQGNVCVSFDPNYRSNLWEGKEAEFVQLVQQALPFSHFVKVSDEELQLITGRHDIYEGIKRLHELGGQTIAVTLGKNGTLLSTGSHQCIVPSMPIQSIDSTGAGDSFVGATLYQLSLSNNPIKHSQDFEAMKTIIAFANRTGSSVPRSGQSPLCQH